MIKFLKQQWWIIGIVAVAIMFFTIVVIVIAHKRRKKIENGCALAIEIKRLKVKFYVISSGRLR